MLYLVNAFSPSMLDRDATIRIRFLTMKKFLQLVRNQYMQLNSAVSHELTAELLTKLIGLQIYCNRINITLFPGDVALGAVPLFRAEQAREFTQAELESAAWKFWEIKIGWY